MLTELRIQNFKSWRDTGSMRFAPLTGFFGPNSSGKTSILQLLLLWKQTVETHNDPRVLNLGDNHSYVDFGSFSEIVFRHQNSEQIAISMEWKSNLFSTIFKSPDPLDRQPDKIITYRFEVSFRNINETIVIARLAYSADKQVHHNINNGNSSDSLHSLTDTIEPFQMLLELKEGDTEEINWRMHDELSYKFSYQSGSESINTDPSIPLVSLFYMYNWMSTLRLLTQKRSYYTEHEDFQIDTNIRDFTASLEHTIRAMVYLGPLREYPSRIYLWRGDTFGVSGVGNKGEVTIQVLLNSQHRQLSSSEVQEDSLIWKVATWLKRLRLIDSFEVVPIAEGRREYEVRVKISPDSPEVLLTEVGFGVSQVLPVLTLCYQVPEGSTIILEQPEIHLHPAVQAGLADVFIDVIKNRGVQIILESHSEHLLNRLQRRMAEEQLVPADVALYFTHMENGESKLEELKIDEYGNISNWPDNFFGDEMGDLVAMAEAAMKRQLQAQGQHA